MIKRIKIRYKIFDLKFQIFISKHLGRSVNIMLTKDQKYREKELQKLIYLKSLLIKESKKEIVKLRKELESLGNGKAKSINRK